MAMKMDVASLLLGVAIAVGALAVYDYYFWTSGGLLYVGPSEPEVY